MVVALFIQFLVQFTLLFKAHAVLTSHTACSGLPKIQNLASIHDQFQLLQLGSSSVLTELQEKEIAKIFKSNPLLTHYIGCFADVSRLSDFLTVLKLQIIEIRVASIKHQKVVLESGLNQLREVQNKLVIGNSSLERRLAATVRSLLLDELEKLGIEFEALTRDQLKNLFFFGNPGEVIRSNIASKIKLQRDRYDQFVDNKKLFEQLADDLSKLNWEGPSPSKSALTKILGHFQNHPMNLKGQLDSLFSFSLEFNKGNKNAILDLSETQNNLNYYAQVISKEIQKNPYLSIKDWMDPVVQGRVKTLKQELGYAWPLIEGLGGVTLEGKYSSIKKPLEILDSVRFSKAKESFVKTKNPMGRLFEIIILREAQQEWTDVDVAQLKTDLNRAALMTTSLAISDYMSAKKRAPSSIEDLVLNKLLTSAPKDYFTGEPFRYSVSNRRVWSVGENKKDEQGDGDDISVTIKN